MQSLLYLKFFLLGRSYQYRNHAVAACILRELLTFPPLPATILYLPYQLRSCIFALPASKTPQRGIYTHHLQCFSPIFP